MRPPSPTSQDPTRSSANAPLLRLLAVAGPPQEGSRRRKKTVLHVEYHLPMLPSISDMRSAHIENHTMKVKSKVWIEVDGNNCFGAGKARILEAIETTGSISAAARSLNMSYRHAWSAIQAAESRLQQPLLQRHRGGNSRGGATLTPFARELLTKFGIITKRTESCADKAFAHCFRKQRRPTQK